MTRRFLMLSIAALAFQARPSAYAMSGTGNNGQVRCLGELRVPYGAQTKTVQRLRAVKVAEGALLETADAKTASVDFSQAGADLALSHDEKGLHVELTSSGKAVSGDVVVNANGRYVRQALGGKAGLSVTIPWTRFGGANAPAGDVRCVFDLAWEGVGRKELLALSEPQRRETMRVFRRGHLVDVHSV